MKDLKVIFALFFFLVFGVTVAFAQSKKPLTNDDVIQMVKAGFTEQTITDAIKADKTTFDTSVQGLVAMKNAGVSQKVIDAMLEATADKKATTPVASAKVPATDPNDPMSPHGSGIYWQPKERRDKHMVELDPSVYSQAKSGGLFKSAMTYGIAKAKWKAVVRGSRATVRTSETAPEFWFYFNVKSTGLSQSGSFLSAATSPNEFILAKMERKHKDRELVVDQFGAFGSSTGTRSKDTVAFDFVKMAPGIYKVTPREPLKPGEYCFLYAGTNMAMGMTGGKLYAFGIDPPR